MRRKLALSASLLALSAGGAAAAIAATGSSPHRAHHGHGRHGVLAAAAGYLGVSTRELRQELRAGKSLGEIAKQTPGRSEAGLIAVLQAQMPERIAALVQHAGGPRRPRSHAARKAALAYLGLSAKQLQAKLRGGQTLAQVADATPGKSAAGLALTIVDARRARLAQALAHGLIARHAAAAREGKLRARVHATIDRQRASAPAH